MHVFEENEAVIRMIIKVRHVSRTHRVAPDGLFDGNFTRDEWNNLLHLFKISHFSSLCCAKNFSVIRRTKNDGEEDAGTERRKQDCGDIHAAMTLVSSVAASSSSVKHPIASGS